MLRLWGRLSSINVRKVVWTVQELGLELQRTDAGGQFGIVCEPPFLRLNPNGMVPLIEDDGFTLWESNAIVRYLCAKHASGTLYPEDLRTRFVAEQWMDWRQTTLNPAGRDAFLQWVRTPEAQRDPAAIARSVAATEPLLTGWRRTWRSSRAWPASASPWPTSWWAARSTAGGACRRSALRAPTSTPGTRACCRAPAHAA